MKKILALTLALVMAISLFAGCAAPAETAKEPVKETDKTEEPAKTEEPVAEEDITIGFAMKTLDSPYFISLVDAVEKQCAEKGWTCKALEAGMDSAKEAENMESFMAQNVDLIFLDCVEPNAVVSSINTAADMGIPVINLDSASNDANFVTTIYSDNLQNARMVGLAYAASLPEDEEIIAVLLSALKGNIATRERRLGLFAGIIEGRTGISEEEGWAEAEIFLQELVDTGKATHEGAKFVLRGQGWGEGTRELGLVAAEDLITANQDVTCILGENDQMLFGAMTALANAGIEGVDLVAAADGAKEAYDLIKKGEYFGTGENSPYMIAQMGMEIAEEILVEGKDPTSYEKVILTEAIAVTAENVDERYDFGF